jgi:hypothetical protein
MISRDFTYQKRELVKRLQTIIYRKLKTFLKCYSITNFEFDRPNRSFSFKITHKKKDEPLMPIPKLYMGRYEAIPLDKEEKMYNLKIIVDNF